MVFYIKFWFVLNADILSQRTFLLLFHPEQKQSLPNALPKNGPPLTLRRKKFKGSYKGI